MKLSILMGRVGRSIQYTPAYNDGNKDISQMLKFSLAPDEDNPKKREDKDTADFIDISLWGPYADVMTKLLSKGKYVAVTGELSFYQSRLIDKGTGNYLVNSQGVPVYTPRISIRAEKVKLIPNGDSANTIMEEFQNFANNNQDPFMVRPPGYKQPGTQDALIWDRIKEARKSATYQPGMNKFGFAEVMVLGNGKRPIESKQPRNQMAGYTQNQSAPVYPNQPPAPVYPNQPQPQNQWANPGTAQPMQQYANQYTNLQPQPQQNQQFAAQQNSWAQQPQQPQQQNVQPAQQNDLGF